MKHYAIVKDSVTDSIFGIIVKSGQLETFYGVGPRGLQWSNWANGTSVKSAESTLPAGVVIGNERPLPHDDSIFISSLVEIIAQKNPPCTSQEGFREAVVVDSPSTVPAIRDAHLRAFDDDRRNNVVNYKALAFVNDSNVASLLGRVRTSRFGFSSKTGEFISRDPVNSSSVVSAEIINSFGKSVQRSVGISLLRTKFKTANVVARNDAPTVAHDGSIQFKALGGKLGGRLGGGLRSAGEGFAFVDITGVTDADTDGIVFEGKKGLERPIIPRFRVPKDLARKLSKLVTGDAEALEKQRRAGNATLAIDEGKLRETLMSLGADGSVLERLDGSPLMAPTRTGRMATTAPSISATNRQRSLANAAMRGRNLGMASRMDEDETRQKLSKLITSLPKDEQSFDNDEIEEYFEYAFVAGEHFRADSETPVEQAMRGEAYGVNPLTKFGEALADAFGERIASYLETVAEGGYGTEANKYRRVLDPRFNYGNMSNEERRKLTDIISKFDPEQALETFEARGTRGMASRGRSVTADRRREQAFTRKLDQILGREASQFAQYNGVDALEERGGVTPGQIARARRAFQAWYAGDDRGVGMASRGGKPSSDPLPQAELDAMGEREFAQALLRDRFAGLSLEEAARRYRLKDRMEARRVEAREMQRLNAEGRDPRDFAPRSGMASRYIRKRPANLPPGRYWPDSEENAPPEAAFEAIASNYAAGELLEQTAFERDEIGPAYGFRFDESEDDHSTYVASVLTQPDREERRITESEIGFRDDLEIEFSDGGEDGETVYVGWGRALEDDVPEYNLTYERLSFENDTNPAVWISTSGRQAGYVISDSRDRYIEEGYQEDIEVWVTHEDGKPLPVDQQYKMRVATNENDIGAFYRPFEYTDDEPTDGTGMASRRSGMGAQYTFPKVTLSSDVDQAESDIDDELDSWSEGLTRRYGSAREAKNVLERFIGHLGEAIDDGGFSENDWDQLQEHLDRSARRIRDFIDDEFDYDDFDFGPDLYGEDEDGMGSRRGMRSEAMANRERNRVLAKKYGRGDASGGMNPDGRDIPESAYELEPAPEGDLTAELVARILSSPNRSEMEEDPGMGGEWESEDGYPFVGEYRYDDMTLAEPEVFTAWMSPDGRLAGYVMRDGRAINYEEGYGGDDPYSGAAWQDPMAVWVTHVGGKLLPEDERYSIDINKNNQGKYFQISLEYDSDESYELFGALDDERYRLEKGPQRGMYSSRGRSEGRMRERSFARRMDQILGREGADIARRYGVDALAERGGYSRDQIRRARELMRAYNSGNARALGMGSRWDAAVAEERVRGILADRGVDADDMKIRFQEGAGDYLDRITSLIEPYIPEIFDGRSLDEIAADESRDNISNLNSFIMDSLYRSENSLLGAGAEINRTPWVNDPQFQSGEDPFSIKNNIEGDLLVESGLVDLLEPERDDFAIDVRSAVDSDRKRIIALAVAEALTPRKPPRTQGMRSEAATQDRPYYNVPVLGSSALRQASYDEENQDLIVTFANGQTYTYEGVGIDDIPDVLTGTFINELKKRHSVRKGGEHAFDPIYQRITGPGQITGRRRLSRSGSGTKTQIPVNESSAIEALTWDDRYKDLIVTYRDGGTYTYKNVDDYWVDELENNPNDTGRIVNNIKKEDYRVVRGGEHGKMPDEFLTAERSRFGMRSSRGRSEGRMRERSFARRMDQILGREGADIARRYGVDALAERGGYSRDQIRRARELMRAYDSGNARALGMGSRLNLGREKNVLRYQSLEKAEPWTGVSGVRDVENPTNNFTGDRDVYWSDRIILSAPSDGRDTAGKVYMVHFDEDAGIITVKWGKASKKEGELKSKSYSGQTREDFFKLLYGKEKRGYRLEGGSVPPLWGGQERQDWRADHGKQRKLGMRSEVESLTWADFQRWEQVPPTQDDASRINRGGKTRVDIGESRAVRAVTYDDDSQDLIVTYNNGRTYTYYGVDDDLIRDLEESKDSVGKLINRIKNSGVQWRETGVHAPSSTLMSNDQRRRAALGMRSRSDGMGADEQRRLAREDELFGPRRSTSLTRKPIPPARLQKATPERPVEVAFGGNQFENVSVRFDGSQYVINHSRLDSQADELFDGPGNGRRFSNRQSAEQFATSLLRGAGLGSRGRTPSADRMRTASMDISSRPRGMASRRNQEIKDRRFAIPGRDKVDPTDGKIWSGLSDDDKATVSARATEREKYLFNEMKKRYPRWWAARKREAQEKGWSEDLPLAGMLTELHRKVDALIDDPNIPDKQKEQEYKIFDDLQALFQMRLKGEYDLLEHLHTASRKSLFDDKRRNDGKTTALSVGDKRLTSASTANRTIGGVIDGGTPIREQVGENAKKSFKERRDDWYKRMTAKIIYADPARAEKKRLKKLRKQGINVGGYTESTGTAAEDAVRKVRVRKRARAMRKLGNRNGEQVMQAHDKNRVPGAIATINDDGSLTIGKDAVQRMATAWGKFAKREKINKTKGGVNRNRLMATLWDGASYNGTPHLITREEYDRLVKEGWRPVMRGHGNDRNATDYIDSPIRFIPGQGGEAQGEGEYWSRPDSASFGTWTSWLSADRPAATIGLLPPNARRAQKGELRKHQNEHREIMRVIDNFDKTLPQGEREKMPVEDYIAQLNDYMRQTMGGQYETAMGTTTGQLTAHILSALAASPTPAQRQQLLDALSLMKDISRRQTPNLYAPLLGYDSIIADSGVELIHNRTATAVIGETFKRDDALAIVRNTPRRRR